MITVFKVKWLVGLGLMALSFFESSNAVYSPYGGYSSGYGTCGTLKVTEVLDQIYCHHGYYTRFTSTDLAAIRIALFQLGLVSKFVHIKACLDYVNQAIYILQELKAEVYKSFDSSELSKYSQGYDDLGEQLKNLTGIMQGYEDVRGRYIKNNPFIIWGNFTPDEEYNEGKSKRQVSGFTSGQMRSQRSEANSDYDYAGDYTCGYISSSYCSTNSLVVKNVLSRIIKALYSQVSCLAILDDYIRKNDCGEGNSNKLALLVTPNVFGSIQAPAQVLLEAAKYEYKLYTSLGGGSGSAYSSNLYGRSGGSASGGGVSVYPGYPYGVYMIPAGSYRYSRNVGAITPPRSGSAGGIGK